MHSLISTAHLHDATLAARPTGRPPVHFPTRQKCPKKFGRTDMGQAVPIPPRCQDSSIPFLQARLSKLGLKYSRKYGLLPITLQIKGISPDGRVLENGEVLVDLLAEVYALRIAIGDQAEAQAGSFMGAVPCLVDGDDQYTGVFRLTSVSASGTFVGTAYE